MYDRRTNRLSVRTISCKYLKDLACCSPLVLYMPLTFCSRTDRHNAPCFLVPPLAACYSPLYVVSIPYTVLIVF